MKKKQRKNETRAKAYSTHKPWSPMKREKEKKEKKRKREKRLSENKNERHRKTIR